MKLIEEYNFPEELKYMSDEELSLLAVQIREFLIEKVSRTGGHLASNLGVVELTIALHKVFNSPKDKLIWDVGHQSYVHKILTGRASGFDNLRKFGGLSGFPKAKESEHDAFDTGHSTTSLSVAAGMAAARDIKGDDNEVIAIIGDGSMTGGMAYEAMDNIGFKKSKMIIILNDNGMSISRNVGGISRYLGEIRTSKNYLKAKDFIKAKFDSSIAQGLANVKNDIKYSILDNEGLFFEGLGLTYFGPIDGHNITELIKVMRKAKTLNEPVLIHCITKKGKGYTNAEKYPRKFHGISPFDPETGEITAKNNMPSYSSVMGKHLLKMAKKDESIVAITAAMGEATGLKDYSIEIPDRYFDVGIAEEHAVTFAAGLAKEGLKPFVCIYSSFLQRAYDQLIEDVCLQELNVVFMLDRAGVVGADGETHNGLFDISYLSSMPNMTVLAPKDGNELTSMMDWAVKQDGPVAIRYPRGECVYNNEIMSFNSYSPKSKRIDDGILIDVWATGKMFETGNIVRNIISSKGCECGLVDVSCIKPLDISPYYDCNCRYIVSIEDNTVKGGFGTQLKDALNGEICHVISFGWPDRFIEHGSFEELADKYELTPEKIASKAMDFIKDCEKKYSAFDSLSD